MIKKFLTKKVLKAEKGWTLSFDRTETPDGKLRRISYEQDYLAVQEWPRWAYWWYKIYHAYDMIFPIRLVPKSKRRVPVYNAGPAAIPSNKKTTLWGEFLKEPSIARLFMTWATYQDFRCYHASTRGTELLRKPFGLKRQKRIQHFESEDDDPLLNITAMEE